MAKKKSASTKIRRGLDPEWHETDADFTIFAVLASGEKVANAYRRLTDTEGPPVDCLEEKVKIVGEDWERAIFVYELKGSPWTHVQSPGNRVGWTDGEELSKTLRTKLIVYGYQGTVGGFGYELFANGRSVEQFFSCPLMEERDQMIADGWQISKDSGLQLRSKRLGQVDMNVAEARELPDQIARDLDVYIPPCIWVVDPRTEMVKLVKPWSRDDVEAAQVLLSKW